MFTLEWVCLNIVTCIDLVDTQRGKDSVTSEEVNRGERVFVEREGKQIVEGFSAASWFLGKNMN